MGNLKETSSENAVAIRDIALTCLRQTRRQFFQSDPDFIVVTIDGRQRLIELNPTSVGVFSSTSAFLSLEHTSSVLFEVFRKGVFRKKLLGSLTCDERYFGNFTAGIHKLCLDLVVVHKAAPMQLSFSLEVRLPDGVQTHLPQSLSHDVIVPTAVELGATNAVADVSEPTAFVSETLDLLSTIKSAHTTAENVAAYYTPFGEALELVDRLLEVVSTVAEVHVLLQTAYLAMSSAYWILRKQTELDVAVKDLAEAMVKMFSWVKEAESLEQMAEKFTKTIGLMAEQATECAVFIKDYAIRGFLGRTVHSNVNLVDETVQRFRQNFDALLSDFDRGAIISTFRMLTRTDTAIRDVLDKQQDSETREDRKELITTLEKGLPRVSDAHFDPGRTCLYGTREAILKEIYLWSSEPGGESVYWLRAEAGTGKTTISHTVADRAAKLGQLGGCFFLHRDYADRRVPRLVINTLAFRLAYFHPVIAAEIKAALDKDPDLGRMDSIRVQFDRLILDPIAAVKNLVEPITRGS